MGDIFFHGIPLENIAGARITEITVSPIKWTAVARERPVRAGADFVRMVGGTRTVTATFVLLEKDMETRQSQLLAINAWLKTDAPQRLVLPGHPGRYLMAACTEFPEPQIREWWQEARVTWTCYDPYWVSMTERSEDCGTQFKAVGSAPPRMWITDTLSASGNRAYSDGTDTLTFNALPAGDLVIDLERQTAQVGNNSVMEKMTFASTWPIPKTGVSTITGTGTVHWQERWV